MTWPLVVAALAVGLVFMLCGALLLSRARVVGALLGLTGVGCLATAGLAAAGVAGHALVVPVLLAGLGVFSSLVLVYPDGRTHGPLGVLALVFVVAAALLGTAYGGEVAALLGMGIAIVVPATVWWRHEILDEEQRLAVLWLCLGAGAGGVVAGLADFLVTHPSGPVVATLAVAVVPVAMVVGVLRPHLLDVRSLLVQLLVNTVAAVLVLAIFGGGAAVVELVLERRPSLTVLGILAVVSAVFFHAARVLLTGVIDRLLFGDRPDPLRAATHVGEHISDDPVFALRAIREALSLPYAALRYDGQHVAASGNRITTARVLPLTIGERVMGELEVGLRPGQLLMDPHDESVLRVVVPALTGAARAWALAADLQESREQAVAAVEEERRRIRRDLHDGLGSTLTGAAYTVDAARNLMRDDPLAAEELLGALRDDMSVAIEEVRRLVYAMRPPALDELGLVRAVEQQARGMHRADGTALQVEVVAAESLPELPAAVEVAAYRIVVEALTNVCRHSSSGSAHVELSIEQEILSISVRDSGRTVGPWRPGVGISAMRERAEEVGGVLRAEARPHGGEVTSQLPLAAPLPRR